MKGESAMGELYGALLALLLILLLGAVMQKTLRLGEAAYQGMNALVVRVTLPAMILSSMDKPFSAEMAGQSVKLVIIAAGAFGAVVLGLEIWRRVSRLDAEKLGLYQYLILVGNTAFMGYPVVRALYGSDGVFYASVFNLVHNFVTFSYGIGLLVRGKRTAWGGLLKNACLLATVAGVLLFVSPFALPAPVHQALSDVGGITIPLCLLIVGARLAGQPLRALVRPAALWPVSLTRLVLFPLLLIPLLRLSGCAGVTLAVPAILFATPAALTAGTFAEQYGADGVFAGRAVVLSNLLALATLPVVVAFVS